MDDTRDDGADARWVSYAQLAKARTISKESAIRLARRERWRKMPGNDADKTVRVLVPQIWLQPAARADALPRARADTLPDVARLEAANVRADEANKRADVALAVADRTLAQLAASNAANAEERERVTDLQRELAMTQSDLAEQRGLSEQARAEAQEAQEAIRRLEQEADARKARGRLRRAWEGWRGR